MTPISHIISRVRKLVKGVKQEALLTDRFIYSLVLKHAKLLMRRQDARNNIMRFNPVFQALDFVPLIDTDTVQASCIGLESGLTIKRTEEKLPTFMEGYWGPLIRAVTSVDGSEELMPTYPTTYLNMSKQKNFRFNKTKYYWFLGGYLFFPNLEWDAIKLEGVFEDDVSKYNCDCEDDCIPKPDQSFNVPDYLHADIEKLVLADLGLMLQVPMDNQDDGKNLLK